METILLEDGSGEHLMEDGTGSVLLETSSSDTGIYYVVA